jgi:hypothetical protein
MKSKSKPTYSEKAKTDRNKEATANKNNNLRDNSKKNTEVNGGKMIQYRNFDDIPDTSDINFYQNNNSKYFSNDQEEDYIQDEDVQDHHYDIQPPIITISQQTTHNFSPPPLPKDLERGANPTVQNTRIQQVTTTQSSPMQRIPDNNYNNVYNGGNNMNSYDYNYHSHNVKQPIVNKYEEDGDEYDDWNDDSTMNEYMNYNNNSNQSNTNKNSNQQFNSKGKNIVSNSPPNKVYFILFATYMYAFIDATTYLQ